MKRFIPFFIVLILLIGSLYYANSINTEKVEAEKNSQSHSQELTEVVIPVSEIPAGLPFTPTLFVIKDQNIDEKYGINIQINKSIDVQGFVPLLTKEVNIAPFNPTALAQLNFETGEKIKGFAGAFVIDTQLLSSPDSELQKPEDLKGKRLGTFQKTSVAYVMAKVLFDKLGLDIEKDFDIVEAPIPALIALLEKNDIDAYMSVVPISNQLISINKIKPLTSNEIWQNNLEYPLPELVWAADEKWLNSNKGTALAFSKTWYEAAGYVLNHPEIYDNNELREALGIKSQEEADLWKNGDSFLPVVWNSKKVEDLTKFIEDSKKLNIVPQKASSGVFVVLN